MKLAIDLSKTEKGDSLAKNKTFLFQEKKKKNQWQFSIPHVHLPTSQRKDILLCYMTIFISKQVKQVLQIWNESIRGLIKLPI